MRMIRSHKDRKLFTVIPPQRSLDLLTTIIDVIILEFFVREKLV